LARGTAANPDYQNNLDRFHALGAVILDESGAHSKDEQLDAWNSWFRMAVTGQLMGFGPDEAKTVLANAPTERSPPTSPPYALGTVAALKA